MGQRAARLPTHAPTRPARDDAAQGNANRVEDIIVKLSGDLAKLNVAMTEYKVLLDRQQELRKKMNSLNEEIAQIQQIGIHLIGGMKIAAPAEPLK